MNLKGKKLSLKTILVVIAAGIWVIALQNLGVIPIKQKVIVTNEVDADVSGSVSVDNTVDVNLYKINNQRNVFFNNPRRGEKDKYYVIPVSVE